MTKQKVKFASRRKKLHNIWSTRLDEFFNYKKLFFVSLERKENVFLLRPCKYFLTYNTSKSTMNKRERERGRNLQRKILGNVGELKLNYDEEMK